MRSRATALAAERKSMPSTHKKVIVRKLDRDAVQGYVNPAAFVVDGKVALLTPEGQVQTIGLEEVKGVYFVREFGEPESFARKTFPTRPRTEGLWVRLKFRDNEVLEGMMANDLTQAAPEGYLINPPDTRANTQRIFVPRTALAELHVLAVIGGPRARRPRAAAAADARQESLFSE
jgi:hypothetical protein